MFRVSFIGVAVSFIALVYAVDQKSSEEGSTPAPLPILNPTPTYGGKNGNPGAILRLTKNLLFADVQKACKNVERKPAEQRTFDDFSIPTSDGRIVVSRPRLTSLTLPVVLGELYAPKTVSWSIHHARMTVLAIWTYFSNNNSVNYTGQVYIPPTLFDAEINTTMGRNSEMQPSISSSACNVEVAELKVFFTTPSAKARMIVDEVQSNITHEIKETLQKDMCDLLRATIQIAINSLLYSLQTKYELWSNPNIILDYSLIADPFVDHDCSISMWMKGLMSINGRNALTFYPHELIHQNMSSKLIDVLFSDYMLNSLLQSSFQSDLLHFVVTSNSSEAAAEVLQYTCSQEDICLGKIFPSVVDFPSDWIPEVLISATRPPTAVFQNGSAFLQAYAFMKIDMRQPNSLVRTTLVSLPFSVVAVLKPKMSKNTRWITMCAKIASLKFDVVHPKQAEIAALIKPIVNQIINKPLQHGIPIPMFMTEMIQFANSTLALNERTMSLQTDFKSEYMNRRHG